MVPFLKDYSIRVGPGYETTEVGCFGSINVSSNVTIVGGLKGGDAWRGVTTIASGTTSIVVSHANMAANSGYPIFTSMGVTTIASHGLLTSFVNTVADGISFTIAVSSPTGDSQEVAWMVIRG